LPEIIFLIRDLHFGGGGERVTVNLSNYFVDKGFEVTIVTLAIPGKENIFSVDQRIRIDYLNADIGKGFSLFQKVKSLFAVKKYFSLRDKPGIVLGIGTYPNLLLSLVSPKNNLVRVGCLHCSFSSLDSRWRFLGKAFFHRLDALVSLTEVDVPYWRTMNRKILVIPNAVSFFPETAALLSNKVILSVGRIDYSKGFDLLLKVFKRFSQMNEEWSLRIIGDGPLKGRLKKEILKNAMGERVEIVPPTSAVLKHYLDASVFVSTSRTEGFPMVLLEAQACGLPVVSFNCKTGPAEIIHHGSDGFLVEPYDVNKMSESLLELCSDIDKRRFLGNNGRENAKNYLAGKIGKQWEGLFSEL